MQKEMYLCPPPIDNDLLGASSGPPDELFYSFVGQDPDDRNGPVTGRRPGEFGRNIRSCKICTFSW